MKEALEFIAFAAERVGPPLYALACEFWGCEANMPAEFRAALRAAVKADLAGEAADVDRRIDEKLGR